MTLRIAHLSGTRFGAEDAALAEALTGTLLALSPDLVVLSGDITNAARAEEFAAASGFMANLAPLRVLVVPGPRDLAHGNIKARLLHPTRAFSRAFGTDMSPRTVLGGIEVVGFNSAAAWGRRGKLDPELVAGRLARLAEVGGAQLRVAVLHHPLDGAPAVAADEALDAADEVVRAMQANGVDLVLGGHPGGCGVSLSTAHYPALPRSMVLARTGSCLARETAGDGKHAFNLLQLEAGSVPWIEVAPWRAEGAHAFRAGASERFFRSSDDGWGRLPT
jgi:3',5'-cyclic AMP phosphodiesterase CpdA